MGGQKGAAPWEKGRQAPYAGKGKYGKGAQDGFQGLNQPGGGGGGGQLANTLVDMFSQKYPIDQDAYNYLLSSSPSVVDRVVREFKPKIEGEADYSTLVMSFRSRRN